MTIPGANEMPDEDQNGSVDENLAVGDTPSGNPPFLVYKRRLYVLSKKAPSLRRAGEEARQALEVQARPGQRPRALAGRQVRRAARARTRPFVKGTYRVYSSRFPHLAPAGRRKPRKRIPRTLE
jgi:hypothetical protein